MRVLVLVLVFFLGWVKEIVFPGGNGDLRELDRWGKGKRGGTGGFFFDGFLVNMYRYIYILGWGWVGQGGNECVEEFKSKKR